MKTITKSNAAITNIPVLRTSGYETNEIGKTPYVIYTFVGSFDGIYAPFEGVFLLNITEAAVLKNPSSVSVFIDNIYGETQQVYIGDVEAMADNIAAGCHLMHFDTDTRKLHLVR